jgi:hypothetical protein
LPPPLTLVSQEVYKAINGLKAGTKAGPSGLRDEHLKKAKGRGAAALGAITRLVNTMAMDEVPKEVAPFFFGANLFALMKKAGDTGLWKGGMCFGASP